ncbi:hypothetical protein PHLCEN_2v7058 [Hermanssonia centrifuga]|uniref:Uncharacterized protein n=1 Tax=Hermanssonia centrifuga TaxID=98765 RepID=A0A2R6NXQ1_9APHY|nr:hypothetical protein PHLCEN_2v7058 [Hermanssonia centrifuga]
MSDCPLPNAETALAWLPPDVGAQLQASAYLYVATLGVQSIRSAYDGRRCNTDYFSTGMDMGLLDGFMGRIDVGNVGNCNALLIAIGTVGTIAVPANSYLMFMRVRAVFNDSKPIVIIFGFLWVATLAGSITAPFSLKGVHIGTTQRCINSEVKQYGSAGIIIATCNDTLIFLAITYRLIMHHVPSDSWSHRLRGFLRGDGMGKMSKLLLQTGQLYYLYVAALTM